MEMKDLMQKCVDWIKKYKYAALIMLLGVILMCIPAKDKTKQVEQEIADPVQQITIEEKLENVLSQLQGAGKVKVMLTISQGEKTVYQYDEEIDYGENDQSIRKDTVIITDADRNEQALVSQMLPPVYLGAVIICQGADQPSVKLAVVEAVSKITGLGADKICVLKMK